jgi:hypothetical protein
MLLAVVSIIAAGIGGFVGMLPPVATWRRAPRLLRVLPDG